MYTWDVFSSLDGFASYDAPGDWGGYWGKQGPEFLDRRLALYQEDQRLVFGGTTFRQFLHIASLDYDLELLEHRLFDGRSQELTYRPTPR